MSKNHPSQRVQRKSDKTMEKKVFLPADPVVKKDIKFSTDQATQQPVVKPAHAEAPVENPEQASLDKNDKKRAARSMDSKKEKKKKKE